jgi:hypothetical protein
MMMRTDIPVRIGEVAVTAIAPKLHLSVIRAELIFLRA